jgi:hypothetical protein
MSIGKIFYYILLGPALLVALVYHVFYMIAMLLEFAKDTIDELLDQIKEF